MFGGKNCRKFSKIGEFCPSKMLSFIYRIKKTDTLTKIPKKLKFGLNKKVKYFNFFITKMKLVYRKLPRHFDIKLVIGSYLALSVNRQYKIYKTYKTYKTRLERVICPNNSAFYNDLSR